MLNLANSGVLNTLFNSINAGEKITIFGCDMDAKLTILKESGKSIFFVTQDIKEAVSVKEKYEECGFRVKVLNDLLDFNLSPFSVDYNIDVLHTLCDIVANNVDVVVVNPMFLKYTLPDIKWLESKILKISKGDQIDVQNVIDQLIGMGFIRTDSPSVNEFCVKGDMIDICTDSMAIRLYFDYDTLAYIKEYDRSTLLNTNELDEFTIYPNEWFDDVSKAFDEATSDQLNDLNTYSSKLKNILWCIPFAKNMGSRLCDYIGDGVLAFSDTKSAYNYLSTEQDDLSRFKVDKNIKLPSCVVGFQYITNQNRLFDSHRVFNVKTIPVTNYVGNNNLLVSDLQRNLQKGYTILIYCRNKDGATKIETLLTANKLFSNTISLVSQAKRGEINLITRPSGLSINLELEKLLIVSNLNILGKPRKVVKEGKSNSFDGFLPKEGDYVVHLTHGVGICKGVECLKLSSNQRDYVIIDYKNNDRLYLPVENIDLIDKYVGEDNPPLNKLGGLEFTKAKEKVRTSVKQLAFNLNNLYAERNAMKGHTYPEDDEIMQAFEDQFGFTETSDQLQAINDMKQDMTSGKIMDRLICGDVGFGKTEVALRGAFKTILGGRQVALLCPTTILSQQHYNTALFRMKNFGVNIKGLNRFCSTKEVTDIMAGLKNGDIDLVIGTHKLLNKNIEFKNLGLLILDEEQKFGVGDKEKIKNLKKNVNVLTLSATPIPRTLNMSLVGIRDISVIDTPPVSRIPTSVKVCEFSFDEMRSAIKSELDRDGQVLVVYNRIEGIYELASKIKDMFPEISIDVAHGQMEQEKLENTIFRLYNNEIQILVSTTLIENGIDLPNANTLIVVDADNLGLSQLYQLKGRVGRSDRQAFALFMYDKNKLLNDNALKRLEAITEYSAMGSGFKIAMRDLEIRGAGSIFGAEQSGHIEKVGYAMYLKLLNEAVLELKGEKPMNKTEIRVDTTLNAYIDNSYIVDDEQRMEAYLKISKIDSSELLATRIRELDEVYGTLPIEISNLCKIALIKNLAEKLGFIKVVLKNNNLQLIYKGEQLPQNLIEGISNFSKFLVYECDKQAIIKSNAIMELNQAVDLLISFLEFVGN